VQWARAAGRRGCAAGIGILANSLLEVGNDDARRFPAMVGLEDCATGKTHAVTFGV